MDKADNFVNSIREKLSELTDVEEKKHVSVCKLYGRW